MTEKNNQNFRIETDDISTMLISTSENIFRVAETCFLKACRKADHVVFNATFSYGCPGEPDDPCCHPENMKEARGKMSKKYGF